MPAAAASGVSDGGASLAAMSSNAERHGLHCVQHCLQPQLHEVAALQRPG